MPKQLWIEAKDIRVGDVIRFRRMWVEVSNVHNNDGLVGVTGMNEDGQRVSSIFVTDELVEKRGEE